MHRTFNTQEIAQLKRAAKILKKERALSHSESLDAIAQRHNWPNWSLLMKNSVSESNSSIVFRRTPDEIRDALRKRSYGEAGFDNVEDLSRQFGSALSAVDYAIGYLAALLARPRFKIWSTSMAYFEMRSWLPYRIHETSVPDRWILVNRVYKPVGRPRSKDDDWAVYEDYPNLFVGIDTERWTEVCDPDHLRSGGIFGDGSIPWHSRDLAQAYLDRLSALRKLLSTPRRH